MTNEQGVFEMRFDEFYLRDLFLHRQPELYFKIFRQDELLKSTEDSVVWHMGDQLTEIVIEVDAPPAEEPTTDGLPEVVPHEVTGQLLNQDTGAPLVGFTVRAFDLDAGAEPRALGYDISNARGLFTVTYTTPRESTAVDTPRTEHERALHLDILDPQAQEIYQTDIHVREDQERVIEVRVPIPSAPEPLSPSLPELSTTLSLHLEPTLVSFLADKGIHTLADIRKAGGISQIKDLPTAADDPAVRALEAHADLGRLSSDPQLNATLIERGFTSVSQIAQAARTDFVTVAHERLGDFKAAQMHVMAQAQTSVLQNILTGIQVNAANGQIQPIDEWRANHPILDTVAPVTCGCADCDAAVSPRAYLADLLDYALGHLKNSGSGIDLNFLVRTFLQPFHALPASCDAVDHEVRQVRLCIEALRQYWDTILATRFPVQKAALARAQLEYRATAYTTLLTRTGASYEEVRLGRGANELDRERLAKRLGIDPIHLGDLILDPATLTEADLETLFGLVDTRTTRNPLDAGQPSNLQQWRLDYLRTLWHDADWPPDAYAQELLPVIDPDLIGPDDFRHPVAKANPADPDTPFDIWVRRRRWVDDCMHVFSTMTTVKDSQEMLDLDAMLRSMYDQPIQYDGASFPPAWKDAPADTDALLSALANGNAPEVAGDATTTVQTVLYLSVESFARLLAIRAKDRLVRSDPRNQPVTSEEWREVCAILTQAKKGSMLAAWRNEAQAIPFDLSTFWIALREPKNGDWPPLYLIQHPLVDPELLALEDIPRERKGRATTRLWQARRARLDQIYDALKQKREAGGTNAFEDMMRLALGDPNPGDALPHNVTTLQSDLKSADPHVVEGARTKITQDLYLTADAFLRLMEIKAKYDDQDPNAKKPTAAEWKEVYALLTTAQKVKREYPDWLEEEGKLPLIDPEVLELADLPDPEAGRDARQFWANRMAELEAISGNLRSKRETLGFDAMLREALGHPNAGDPLPSDLLGLSEMLTSSDTSVVTEAIRNVTTALYMTVEDFSRLMVMKVKSESTDWAKKPTATEWSEVYAILTTAQKQKRSFAAWLAEEQATATGVVYWDALKARLPRWLASVEARQAWQQALLARSSAPLIDPDLSSAGCLKTLTPPNPALGLWQARTSWINGSLNASKAKREAAVTPLSGFNVLLVESLFGLDGIGLLEATLKQIREAKGLEYALRQALGEPLPDLDKLLSDLEGIDRGAARKAYKVITTRLYLTVEDFKRLKTIRDRDVGGNLVTGAEWQEVYTILAQATLVGRVMRLADERNQGEDTERGLEQLFLTRAALAYLVRIQELLISAASILDSEWDQVYAILVQVEKQCKFGEWRREEQARKLTLGPDFFQIPPVDTATFPPPAPLKLPAWRATESARRDWLDTLQSRIDQEQSIIAGLREAVGATEEATLPLLRDALLRVIGTPDNTFEANAKWFTDRFLIDASAGACQKTTRISQAIETIQGILFSLRTGQLNDSYPDLELDADHFDEEWEWIGSYSTWRAAMFVFLYPENILLPGLRKWQTPGFRKLVNDLRSNRRLTPGQACNAAQDYSDYFGDVCSLQLEASCQAPTQMHEDTICPGQSVQDRDLLYAFARGSVTRTVYWSAYDAQEKADYAQTFWEPVPELEQVIKIIGAVPFVTKQQQRFIFLFVDVVEKEQEKLGFTRYDLDKQTWVGGFSELDLPDNTVSFTACVLQETYLNTVPKLLVRTDNGNIYLGKLNAEGGKWEHVLDNTNLLPADGRSLELLDAVGIDPGHYFLFVRTTENGTVQFRWFGDTFDPRWRSLGKGKWCGAFSWFDQQGSFVYAFWNETGRTSYRIIPRPNASQFGPIKTVKEFDDWLKKVCNISLGQVPLKSILTDSYWIRSPKDTITRLLNMATVSSLLDYLTTEANAFKEVFGDNPVEGEPAKGYEIMGEDLILTFGQDFRDKFPAWIPAESIVLDNSSPRRDIRWCLDQLFSHQTIQLRIFDDPETTLLTSITGLDRIAPLNRTAGSSDQLAVYQRLGTQAGLWRSAFKRNPADGSLTEEGPARITPQIVSPFEITAHLSQGQLVIRRALIKSAFDDNAGSAQSNLTYLQEAFYFVPTHLALQLQQSGQYTAALDWFRTVYDYSMPRLPGNQRKIYYGLELEQSLSSAYQRNAQWLLDPLNPHAIAATRVNTYTRFTLLSLVRCFLEFADYEFTRDTAESVSRARTLYLTALELLDLPELNQHLNRCEELIGSLTIQTGLPPEDLVEVGGKLEGIGNYATLRDVVAKGKSILAEDEPLDRRLEKLHEVIDEAQAASAKYHTFADVVETSPALTSKMHSALLTQPDIAEATEGAGALAGREFLQNVSFVSEMPPGTLDQEPVVMPWLRGKMLPSIRPATPGAEPGLSLASPPDGGNGRGHQRFGPLVPGYFTVLTQVKVENPLVYLSTVSQKPGGVIRNRAYPFCIPPNPVVRGLRLHAELNLYKLRNCRNIAGIQRQLDPYAAPTDTTSGLPTIGAGGQLLLPGAFTFHPGPYRYSVLIERAKQLVNHAQQVEAAFFSALEKLDVERYNLLKARQDVRLARAGVQLQQLRVTEAQGGVDLATLQQARAELQVNTYDQWINDGLNQWEQGMITWYTVSAIAQAAADVFALGLEVAKADLKMRGTVAALASVKYGADLTAILAQANINVLGVQASYERRRQEWELQRSLAAQDVLIGAQQVKLAEDHVRVVEQERTIAEMQTEYAEAIVEFLNTKFTNAELYDWMSGVLERVYSFFLQQATAVAQLAANQLAFERQEVPPPFIQADYWDAPSEGGLGGAIGKAPDRRGLTGSARLLQDIFQLDQHAFDTNKRKMQLTKTISLARQAPLEFQRFRETGAMTFATQMKLFDQDFPGHYLRLIKRVRTSVIALIPPTQGIRATLSTTGTSRVVIGGDIFQTIVLRRDPETVALSSPINATGLFELEQQPEMLLPFEGCGVDTTWEFRMPRPANLFDYSTIADVLLTIEYTALNSFDYRQQVIQQLSPDVLGEQPFSFRNQFADAWYELHNPEQVEEQRQMVVRFKIGREDFPAHLERLKIKNLVLYFASADGTSSKMTVSNLSLTQRTTKVVGGAADPINGLISTRGGNASGWATSFGGKEPVGEWELALPNTPDMRRPFKNEEITDILFVITYSGGMPEWV